MKSILKIFSVLILITTNFVGAQLVVKNDTISGTPLSISMDKRIDNLMSDMEDKCATRSTTSSGENTANDSSTRNTAPKIVVPERELTQAEICRRNPRIMGYKIQLAVVKSNEEAREVGMYFRRRFPNMKVEIDASLRPNYKVMAGSYLTKQSAAPDLAKIKPYFNSALAIQYRVFCVEAK
ncbi:SPOR domain-containing protein [Chryseobacterium suipulveris]|uniref:SPOR domain-containing protein n=1 Tax=Chryseobacterium suipulveris TaxID=2929800 RepID=A0ABY4BS27_9FLAO|nr:SPOR domain-containing protein [Chryseobacterium suipulveris]UOE40997.1 SPOR domain-containing protein [Chryseobacterium suipulveris]